LGVEGCVEGGAEEVPVGVMDWRGHFCGGEE
jgi:hypothetical protein